MTRTMAVCRESCVFFICTSVWGNLVELLECLLSVVVIYIITKEFKMETGMFPVSSDSSFAVTSKVEAQDLKSSLEAAGFFLPDSFLLKKRVFFWYCFLVFKPLLPTLSNVIFALLSLYCRQGK